ncbi:MAG TPA: hypothetical protein VHF92_09125 [Geodermatophilus sp.]|nr:hypothetical protein [Geodermatophilus sp.]
MSSPAYSADGRRPTHTPIALIVFAWILVAIPLLYGLYNTVRAAIPLFTGG